MIRSIHNNENSFSQVVYVISNLVHNFFRQKATLVLPITIMFLGTSIDAVYAIQPTAFTYAVQPVTFVERIVPEPIDIQSIRVEDELREREGGPYRFAIPRRVVITPDANGMWEEIDNKTWLWRIHITSPGATSISLGFTRYLMPPGGSLFIYSADGTQVLGPYTEHDNAAHRQLWTPLIHSDDVVVELTIPVSEVANLELVLGSINHGYRRMLSSLSMDKGLGDSDWCEIDVNCPAGNGWRDQIRSVAHYHVTLADGTYSCTGTLINNTAGDDKYYFLTAFHCFDEYDDGVLANPTGAAASMVVYWNFQASTCGGTTGPENQTQTGAYFRAAYCRSDFTLVELDEMPSPAFGIYYAGWDRNSTAPTSGVAIHHPAGDLKKISVENHALTSSTGPSSSPCITPDLTHFKVSHWEEGTTEGGSSGCAFFNPSKRVVGQLSGGTANCDTGGYDKFGRFDISWTGGVTNSTRLSNWLDPTPTGQTTLDGKNPSTSGCKPFDGFETGDFSALPWISSGNANWTITSADKNSGVYSAKAGTITHSQSTSLEVTVDCKAGDIKFYRKVSSESCCDKLAFYIDGVKKIEWGGTLSWTQVTYSVTAGAHTFKWTYSKDGTVSSGSDTAWIDDIEFPCPEPTCKPFDGFETGDFSALPWISSGNANWTITSADKNSGVYSAKAGTITHSQSTSLEVTVDCKAGDVKFYRKVSSESCCDKLAFYIDGVKKIEWGGTLSWTQFTYSVTAGAHTFKWTYSKDSSVSSGSDTAWIDDIEFPVECSVALNPPVLHDEPNITPGLCNMISWDPVSEANEYYAECSSDPCFSIIDSNSGWITSTNYEFCGLTSGQEYWYRAKSGSSAWSQTSQAEFQSDTLVDTMATSDGDVVLAVGDMLATDTLGNADSNGTYSQKTIFNVIECNENALLTEIEMYLGIASSQTLQFVVYETPSESGGYGTFNLIHSNLIASGTGTGWYNSGPIFVPLVAGKSYCIGVAWSGSSTYYCNFSAGFQNISWGRKVSGQMNHVYPAPNSVSVIAYTGTSYYQNLTTSGYSSSGSIVSTAINLPAGGNWGIVDFNKTTPVDTALTVDILPAAGSIPIPGYQNISTGADLSGISETIIRLRANLSTDDPNTTPVLHDWSVTYTDPAGIESVWSNVVSSRQCGTPGDFEPDCDVDWTDLAVLVDQWLQPPGTPSADIAPLPEGDGIVNFLDFAEFAMHWLEGI